MMEARATIATLQRALDRAHEQVRERDALAAALNRKVAKTLANLVHAEERAAELQRRIDESKAAREARNRADAASARARTSAVGVESGAADRGAISFNGKFRDECLNDRWFLSLAHARSIIEDWRSTTLNDPAQFAWQPLRLTWLDIGDDGGTGQVKPPPPFPDEHAEEHQPDYFVPFRLSS